MAGLHRVGFDARFPVSPIEKFDIVDYYAAESFVFRISIKIPTGLI